MENKSCRLVLLMIIGFFLVSCHHNAPRHYDGWKLIWNDEFNTDGSIDSSFWNVEERMTHDSIGEYYLKTNVFCKDGSLIIEGDKHYTDCQNWRDSSTNGKVHTVRRFTSINTHNKMEFLYGRIEICAKIQNNYGAWPAVWTLGTEEPWVSDGEIGLLQYYVVAPDKKDSQQLGHDCNSSPYTTIKNSIPVPLKAFTRVTRKWIDRFHIWRIDWSPESIAFYLDNKLINKIFLSNKSSISHKVNDFQRPHFILFNLSRISDASYIKEEKDKPHYKINYIRVYQKETGSQRKSHYLDVLRHWKRLRF